MARATEQDVIRAFGDLAEGQALLHGRGLCREDAKAVAAAALLIALRTYRTGQRCRFEEYARGMMREALAAERRRERAARRVEARLSLDMRLSYDAGYATYADLYATCAADYTALEVRRFIAGLPRNQRTPLRRAMAGHDPGWDADTLGELRRKALEFGFFV
ncbi:MAG: hypothetical protein VB067_03895 [Christensenellaceae bacterium]|nr:hypothetical protein [Christensenellaceae bacterium]MEA5066821.1 hypothetical protein [Eubacteriales bacterium]MEA5068105.1 hypothetical protein [Christensenellaceae bacterium]